MSSLVGQQVGHFHIVRFLGEGGMAQVFVGEHVQMEREVAVKVLLPEHCQNEQIVQRFINEARALGRINHPGVVDVFEVDRTADGRVCLIMELLRGETLQEMLVRRRGLPIAEAVPLMIQLADTLAAAHDQRIIHRDIKPENIFVVPDQMGGSRIKILDFGIAKLLEGAGAVQTATRTTMGTAAYMPPEQFRSSKYVDHRSDIYALGCVFFEILSGRTPFVGKTLVERMKAHAFDPPPPLRQAVAGAPPELEALIGSMLAKQPDERPQSMRQILAVLQVVGAAEHRVRPASGALAPGAPAPRAPAGSNRALLWAVLAVIGVVGAGVAVILLTG